MSKVKTLLLFMLTGALLGILVTSLIAPGAYVWYQTPGGAGPAQELLVREDVIRTTIDYLLRWQAIGAGIGAVAGLVVGALLTRGPSRRATPPSTATPTAPPATSA